MLISTKIIEPESLIITIEAEVWHKKSITAQEVWLVHAEWITDWHLKVTLQMDLIMIYI